MSGTKKLTKGTLLIARGKRSQGLTGRGRMMKVSRDQEVTFKSPNLYFNLSMTHLSGPLKGVEIEFIEVACRKPRLTDVCRCDAYRFPHQKGKGKCQQ